MTGPLQRTHDQCVQVRKTFCKEANVAPKSSITEVAADAGVSVTTVSHALSGKRAVS
ncbi:MAG: LacI family DNA-binding transcriptional regulator, partial [Propionibacteriaceae bacterium]